MPADVRRRDRVDRYHDHIQTEKDAAMLYRGLAELSRGERRRALAELADIEDRHTSFWEDKLRELGVEPPTDYTPSRRTQSLLSTARRYSPDVVLAVVEQDERDEMAVYQNEPDAPEQMVLDEADHAKVLGRLIGDRTDTEKLYDEPWHRSDKSGTLRAAIFGINDGLVSNTALVMGFAGAATERATVLLAGVAGLLAGAFSMAAGEYISMSNQREAYEREISLEREEIELLPDEERRELELIYRAKGIDAEIAADMAAKMMTEPEVALDTMAREELGLDPDDLGSPWRAAGSSFVSFALGAVLVVLPYLLFSGSTALVGAIGLVLAALIAVGVVMARLNGRPVTKVVVRQVVVGVVAAGATFLLGTILGVDVG